MKNYLISGIVALSVSLGVFWMAPEFTSESKTVKIEYVDGSTATRGVFTLNDNSEIVPLDFTSVSQKVMDAVVHIKSIQTEQYISQGGRQYRSLPDPFRDFFGDLDRQGFKFDSPRQQAPQAKVGTGSGVIINEDGYIVTNNHVIAGAEEIEVTLHDNRTFKALVIGTDPSTDLALIQIDEQDLPTVPLTNSDDVRVGEWVLAVGNPFNLNSTVTAGIVSAKSRNINILQDKYAIESFIQTDAAINPGNSGGALVNLQGALVGINTAIASPTGSYSGYGFAVPSNIVNKVIEDLLKYGAVQRGYLGVTIRDVDGNLAREMDLEINSGVYVDSVSINSAALEAGIEPGDVILEVNGSEVASAPQLQESIARFRPGDEIQLTLMRGKKRLPVNVQLKSRDGEFKYVAKKHKEVFRILGADFEDLDKKTARKLDLLGGVKVVKLYPGKLSKHTNIREGFIITKVDRKMIRDQDDLQKALENTQDGVMVEGIYEGLPGRQFYAFDPGL